MFNKTFAVASLSAYAAGLTIAQPELSQVATQVATTNHNCMTSQDRNKAELDDFWSIYRGSEQFTDDDFGHDNSALFWEDMGEGSGDMSKLTQYVNWKRISEVYDDTHTLFGSNGINHEDMLQGYIGNCWFISGASVLAEIPGRMEKVFINPDTQLSANGIYAVNFFTLGLPHTVIVDDYLPLQQWGSGWRALFAKVSEDKGLWGTVIEKAFAKYHGNYEHIIGGSPNYAVRTLTGAPFYSQYHATTSLDDLWNILQTHDQIDDIIQAGTGGTNHFTNGVQGLANGHAYSVIGVKELSNGEKLVVMRNPWGSEQFTGDWSDSSDLWTDALKEEAGWELKNDGKFFMSVSDYKEQVAYTQVAKDVTDWNTASFLKLNDTTGGNNSSPAWYCGDECTEHNFTLTSLVEQEVWLTAHTWDNRCMADECRSKWNEKYHLLSVTGQGNMIFKYGDLALRPFTMTAGETLDIRTVWNFASEEIPSDFSVIAYAKDGLLALTHTAGLTTDVMPVLGAESTDDSTPDEPVEPDTDPVEPDTDPVEPDTDPVEPDTDPVDPDTDPVDPDTDPVDPDTDPVEDEEIIGEPAEYLYLCPDEGCTQCHNAWMSSNTTHTYYRCTDTTVYAYGNACKERHDRSRCNTGEDTKFCFWSYDFSDSKKFKSDTKKCRTVPDANIPQYSMEEFKYGKKTTKNPKQGLCTYGADLNGSECECRMSFFASENNGWKSPSKMGRCTEPTWPETKV